MNQSELKKLLVLLHNWCITLINSEDKEIVDSKLKVYESEYNRLKELYPHHPAQSRPFVFQRHFQKV